MARAAKVIHTFSTSYPQFVTPFLLGGYGHLGMLRDIVFHILVWKTGLRVHTQHSMTNLSTFYAHAGEHGILGRQPLLKQTEYRA